LYRTNMQPETAQSMFLSYIAYLNKLRDHPEWYNALTKNCTTTMDKQLSSKVSDPQPWSYELVVNGTLDQLLYNRGRFVTNGLSFGELKDRAHINAAAKAADQSPDFSALIRVTSGAGLSLHGSSEPLVACFHCKSGRSGSPAY